GLAVRLAEEGARRQRSEDHRRPADDPALARRQAALCNDVTILDLGQSVLSRDPAERRLHADGRLRHRERGHVDQCGFLCRLREGAERPRALSRDPGPGRRLHLGYLALAIEEATITLSNRGPASFPVPPPTPFPAAPH